MGGEEVFLLPLLEGAPCSVVLQTPDEVPGVCAAGSAQAPQDAGSAHKEHGATATGFRTLLRPA